MTTNATAKAVVDGCLWIDIERCGLVTMERAAAFVFTARTFERGMTPNDTD